MAKVQSLRWPGVTLPSGHVVPARGEIEVGNDVLRQTDNARAFPALIAAGDIAVTYDPDPDPKAPEPAPEPAQIETPAEPVADTPARKAK